jgi:hypothetical protein
MSNSAAKVYNPGIIRQKGIEALTEALGPGGMAYFFRQFEGGQGDYTAERGALLEGVSLEDFEAYVESRRRETAK